MGAPECRRQKKEPDQQRHASDGAARRNKWLDPTALGGLRKQELASPAVLAGQRRDWLEEMQSFAIALQGKKPPVQLPTRATPNPCIACPIGT
jgi:hypothetical protein